MGMKEVPWNSYLYATNPGSKDAVAWAKAIGKMIDMGAAMDTKLLKAGADAHHAAIGGLPASGVCSESQLTAITAAIGRRLGEGHRQDDRHGSSHGHEVAQGDCISANEQSDGCLRL